MAVSFNSYLPNARPRDTYLQLCTGEVVDLRINDKIFHNNGQLIGTARFSVKQNIELFSLSWPSHMVKTATVVSEWRLVITQATTDRIASFISDTAENLGSSNWEVVKDVCSKCREQFRACLLSMSCQQIVFVHEDHHSAEKMKESNEMVDIMNKLLADTEHSYHDIMVDWDVKIHPDQHADPIPSNSNYNSIDFDGDNPSGNSNRSNCNMSENEEEQLPVSLQVVMNLIRRENQKCQAAMAKMAEENANRHRIICHKLEEMMTMLTKFDCQLRKLESRERAAESGISSSSLSSSDTTPENFEREEPGRHHEPEKDSIPSTLLFEEGAEKPPKLPQVHTHSSSEAKRAPKIDERIPSQPPHKNDTRIPSQPPKYDTRIPPQAHQEHRQEGRRHSVDPMLYSDMYQRDTFPDMGEQRALSGSELENRNLDEAVQRAYLHDPEPPPKANSYYTILCLDISESMQQHGAYEEMRNIVTEFIDGVEDIVNATGVEENIGVVTFGGTSNVVQNLTNDFARVRDAVDSIKVGGRSPYVQALLVSMAAFVEKAGIISISRVYDVRPRIIFISDGYPTENTEDGPDHAFRKMHVRTGLTRLMMSFATKKKYDKVRPVVYIPVGENADKELMKSMATLSNGVYMEPKDVKKLCGFFMIQETIGKILACLRDQSDGSQHSDQHFSALASSLMPILDDDQLKEVEEAVKKELANPTKKYRSRISKFEDVFEDTDKVNAGERLPLGTRVLRGPDWRWGEQDGGGPGTVFSHSDRNDWTWVLWDAGGHNRYAYGPDMGFHIWKTDYFPRHMRDDGELEVGMTVEKGPDWNYTDKNLQNVRIGVVVRKSRSEKKVMVRWDNGERQVVRWGSGDKYDVIYCDPNNIPQEAPLEFASFNTAYEGNGTVPTKTPETKEQQGPTVDFEDGIWQWKENDEWHDYPPETSAAIEQVYKKKPQGSRIVNRNGKNRRVMFRRMVEKVVDGGAEVPVQRIPAYMYE